MIQRSGIDLIRLVAPTTRADRLQSSVDDAQGFVYLVARLGVTGARGALAIDLHDSIRRVRAATSLPVAVGFGISTPEQARSVGQMADGVVVGSALVDVLGQDGVGAARRFLGSLRDALDNPAAQ
jgi:tryptophan synthase alpha chain